jgi:hypothetical protein
VIASLGTGLLLTLLVTLGLRQAWGDGALLPGVVFGLLATLIQLVAVRSLGRRMHGSTTEFFRGLGTGMLLRMGGVLLFVLALLVDRGHFPPLPTAFGYLGVLVPLLFLEARFVR